MGKKHRAWWIVGALVAPVVLVFSEPGATAQDGLKVEANGVALSERGLVGNGPSQEREFDHFMALGRRRADFGDKEDPKEYSAETYAEDHNIWRYPHMSGGSITYMLFPAGAYDRRFYWVYLGGNEGEGWLVYQTKTGFNVGSVITYRWKLLLAKDVPDEMPPDLGTLEMLLYWNGLHVAGPVPEEAEPILKARNGYAAYYIDPFGQSFRYWYVRPDGTETTRQVYDWPWPEYAWYPALIPATGFPYQITPEEKSELTKQGWKYRNPPG